MSKLRRFHTVGNFYFITAVTDQRVNLLTANADLLWKSIHKINAIDEFKLLAWVLLPDHLHFVIDPGTQDISRLMQRIKLSFARLYQERQDQSGHKVWQRRFWDHIIRDQRDMNVHIDYIHYNPIKHGYAFSPFEWEHSSIHEYEERGLYSPDWGLKEMVFDGEYGE
jgi:putative transposase